MASVVWFICDMGAAASWRAAVGPTAPHPILPPKGRTALLARWLFVRETKTLQIVSSGTVPAPTLTAPTLLEPPRSLSARGRPKAGMSAIRRATVERRWRMSPMALLDDYVGRFKGSGGASAVQCDAGEPWWEVVKWMEPPLSAFKRSSKRPPGRFLRAVRAASDFLWLRLGRCF
ncbi:hypothetical protein TcCL_NonESM04412 [Trypanosoma cruzi]|nr:hypothetical protein TcCL_NonESM04412 [Trypanosoma cruzi]